MPTFYMGEYCCQPGTQAAGVWNSVRFENIAPVFSENGHELRIILDPKEQRGNVQPITFSLFVKMQTHKKW